MSTNLKIKIAMVGPSRVGKTSLLAAMSARIDEDVEKFGFQFTADGQSQIRTLASSRSQLKDMARGPGMTVDVALGTDPSQEEKTFSLTLSKTGFSAFPAIHFSFVDLPGDWYLGRGEHVAADRLLKEADVIIVAVDSVLLLEAGSKYNEVANNPDTICEGIVTSCTNRKPGTPVPLVLVVGVKAESYLRNSQEESQRESDGTLVRMGEKALRAGISHYYKSLRRLKPAGIQVLGCLVETVGNIVFNHIREVKTVLKGGEIMQPFVTFRRIAKEYSPRHCSVPLRLILDTVLKRAQMAIGPENMLDDVRKFIGFPSNRTAAQEELVKVLEALRKETSDGKKVDEIVFEV